MICVIELIPCAPQPESSLGCVPKSLTTGENVVKHGQTLNRKSGIAGFIGGNHVGTCPLIL